MALSREEISMPRQYLYLVVEIYTLQNYCVLLVVGGARFCAAYEPLISVL